MSVDASDVHIHYNSVWYDLNTPETPWSQILGNTLV